MIKKERFCQICNQRLVEKQLKFCSKKCRQKKSDANRQEDKKRYYQENKLHILERQTKHRENPEYKEHRRDYEKEYRLKLKRISYVMNWKKNNQDKLNQYARKDRNENKEKYKARNYTNNNNQRGVMCLNCKTKKNLQFHHTDYEMRRGLTLCISCHKMIHSGEVML